MMGGWGWHGMMRGPGLFGGFIMLLLFLAVIALVAWLIVRLVRSTSGQPVRSAPPPVMQPDPLLDTLRRRLAEGAITPQEFDELKQKLGV